MKNTSYQYEAMKRRERGSSDACKLRGRSYHENEQKRHNFKQRRGRRNLTKSLKIALNVELTLLSKGSETVKFIP